MAASFLAATAAVLAVGLATHDFFKRHPSRVDRRLDLDIETPEPPRLVTPRPPCQDPIDRAFDRLWEESGTPLERQAALALVVGSGVVGCAAVLVLTEHLLAAAAGLLVGLAVPLAWLAVARWRRHRAMRAHLAETLQVVADGVRSGHHLEQAAALVARETRGPLSQEFAHCASQLRLGHSTAAVLERMARRIPLPEFRIFATAALVHRRTGGNLAMLTERMAAVVRDRQQLRGHLSAVSAGSRLSAVGLVAGSLIAMGVLYWLEPEYVTTFITHPLGPRLLATAAALQLVGTFWVWRILKVSY